MGVYYKGDKLIDPRAWDAIYKVWKDMPHVAPKPGPHPDKDHWWNTNPEIHHFPVDDEENEDYKDFWGILLLRGNHGM